MGDFEVKKIVTKSSLIYVMAVLFYLGLIFGCGGSKEVTKVLTPEEQARIADSIKQAQYDARYREMLIQVNYGNDPYRNEKWEDAIPYFRNALNIDRELHGENLKSALRLRQLGNCYYNINIRDSALYFYEQFSKYETKGEESAQIHSRLIELYREFEQPEKMMTEYYNTIDILEREKSVADLRNYYELLAEIKLTQGDTDEVLRIYNRLIELFPDEKSYQDRKLALMRSTADDETQLQELLSHLEKYPDDINAMQALLGIYSRRNNNDKVLEFADKILAVKTNDVETLKTKAHAFLNLQRYNDAIGIYIILIQVDPINNNHKDYYCEIADCFINLKNYKTAVTEANKALRLDSNYGKAFIKIGQAYEGFTDVEVKKLGGYEKGLKFDEKLAFKKAYDTYEKGTKDPQFRIDAQRLMNSIKNFIPTNEDYFFHKGETKPKNPVYAWMF